MMGQMNDALSPAAGFAQQAIMTKADVSFAAIVEQLLLEEAVRQLAQYIREHAIPLNDYRRNYI